MPSREPSTTCPSPLHFTGSLTCRLGRGRKTNLLPDPGYNVAFFTNICLEQDGGCCPVFKKNHPPGHPSKNYVKKIPSKKCRQNLLLRCSKSPVSKISTLKNDLFCFVPRVNSVAFSAPLLRWRKDTKVKRALHVTDCNSVFVAENC